MAEAAFNTIAEVQRLRDAGFAQAQAEAITLSIHSGVTGGVATKADIEVQSAETRAEIAEVRTEIAALDKKIEVQGATLEAKIDKQGATLEAKIDKQGATLEAKIDKQGATLEAKIDKQGGELRTEVATVRGEIESLRTLIATGQVNQLRWMIGLAVGATGALIAALRFLPPG